MVKEFIFTVGLPGCGKSTYIEEHYKNALKVNTKLEFEVNKLTEPFNVLISADNIKAYLDGYSNENPENVHEDSVQFAKELAHYICDSKYKYDMTVIMDGGGLNRHYTQGIVEYYKNAHPDIKITCIFFDTPIDVCISRVANRERKVPVSAIYDKNLMISECLSRYSKIVDNYIRVDYFTNKYIFLDMDGTIVSYRKGKLDADGNTDFVNSKLFLNANPVPHLIEFVKNNFDMENVYIITAVANNIVLDEKLQWMEKYFPEIKKDHFLWVGNKQYKHVFLEHFSRLKKMDLKDMTIIDDMHETLGKCTKIGMNAIHPSNIYAITDKYSTLG